MAAGTRAAAPSAVDVAGHRERGEETLRTEFDFVLPRGYLDATGTVHRAGVMRLATARDEIQPLRDPRVRNHEAYLTVILLSRVVTKLGAVDPITPAIIEELFATDLAFLQDLYRRVNQEGHTEAGVTCPSCDHEFVVDVAGDAGGRS
ncbi:hypothetical protein [Nitriliruptor alkaliphilus]|uniref:hypothetical protein n=1 Tax=Nitriliruptor alkaliphilus TaxID=427918 RepID=UPI000AF70EB0|nr:hypothetical protein [Nitriliruptor alkaliphilus]